MQALALMAILVSGGVFDTAEGLVSGPGACSACSGASRTPCGTRASDAAWCGVDARLGSHTAGSCANARRARYRSTLYARPYDYRNLLDYPWHAPRRSPPSTFHNCPAAGPQIEAVPHAPEPAPLRVDPSAGTWVPTRHPLAGKSSPSAIAPAAYYRDRF